MLITAMRTAMPNVTCGRITLCGPSATCRVDLDAAVDRPRMHHDRIGLGERELLGRQAVGLEDTPARDGSSAPLMRSFCRRSMMITSTPLMPSSRSWQTRTPISFEVARHQRLRADRAHFGHAERGQRVDVGARDARMQDVADDRHRQVREVLLVVADRVHVEQALRRVRVAAVAGVDHVHVRRAVLRRSGTARRSTRGARRTCRRASRDRLAMVSSSDSPLARRRARDVRLMHVGRQPLGGDLEGGAGARRVLEEQVEHALAAQQRHLLHLAVVDADEGARRCRGCA